MQKSADNVIIELDLQRQASQKKIYRSRSANGGTAEGLIRENENDNSGSDDSESNNDGQQPIDDQREPIEQQLQPFEELEDDFRLPMHGAQLSIVVELAAKYLNDSVEGSDNQEDGQEVLLDDQNQNAFIEEIRPEQQNFDDQALNDNLPAQQDDNQNEHQGQVEQQDQADDDDGNSSDFDEQLSEGSQPPEVPLEGDVWLADPQLRSPIEHITIRRGPLSWH